MIRSKVKLACSGRDDPEFGRFLDEALGDAHHCRQLESEFPAELALYSILKDDIDRARYYSNISLQAFLRVRAGWKPAMYDDSGGGEGLVLKLVM